MRYLALPLVLLLGGCITTSLQPHMNPEYASATYRKVAVGAPNLRGEQRELMEDKTVEHLAAKDVEATPMHELFPAYKRWKPEEIRSGLKEKGVAAALMIQVGASQGSSSTIGYHSTATAQTTGGTTTATGWTMPVRSFSRDTESRAVLIDVADNKNVWAATAHTEGRGSLYSGAEDALADMAGEYADGLVESGLIASQ